jgi:hypothetical protein
LRAVALIGAAVAVALALGAAINAAHASSVIARQPLAVQTASLVQEGQDLVWQVELAERFSPKTLRRDHRSVCLIERAASGWVVSQVCLSGPRSGATIPQLIYRPVAGMGPARGSAIAATVTR